MRFIGKIVAAVAAVVLLVQAGAALAAPPMWVVKDEDSTIYLFGTIHVLSAGTEWRTPAYDQALADSGDLWFEMDTEVDREALGPLMARLSFDFETPLSRKLDAKTMRALRKVFRDQPTMLAMLESMQPWAVAVALMTTPSQQAGQEFSRGADTTATRAGRQAGKRLRYFETAEQQLRVFADLSQDVQIALVKDTLAGLKGSKRAVLGLEDAWQAGDDFEAVGEAIIAEMRKAWPEVYDAIARRRNLAWAAALEKEMAGQGTAMVNVGALHMYGEDGLPALMKARGFTVERVQ